MVRYTAYLSVTSSPLCYRAHRSHLVKILFQNSGIGIPPNDLPHIFERFYRVESELHYAVEGSGLGLVIVKSIIEQHGGQIRVESTVGQGSVFSFTLPLTQAAASA